MQRREFLVHSGLALGVGALSSCVGGNPEARRTPGPGATPGRVGPVPSTWAGVKAEFDLAPDLVHMAAFFLASHSRAVRDAIDVHRRGLDASPYEYIEANIARLETATRAAAAEHLGVPVDEVALTDSTTMGLGVVYGGVRLRPDQEILSTTHDHIATALACSARAERAGARFRQVPLYDDPAKASAAAIADALGRAIRPETRVIAVTWVHSGTGVKLPIRALADQVARANTGRAEADRALLVVDGVHGFGLEDVTAADLGCDALVTGCHKWLFGPRGTGMVWAKPSVWSVIDPAIPSFDAMWRPGPPDAIPRAGMLTPGGFHSFEHRWALESAFRFHLAVGKPRIAARVHELNRHLKEELAKIPRVKVMTPLADELSAGIDCFTIDNQTPADTVARLRTKGIIASVTPPFYDPPYARLSAGLLTVESDLDRALAAVRSI